MIKELLRANVRRLGYDLISADRFGAHVEVDLARLTAQEPLHTVFDVGGNFGQTALRFARMFPVATVFTFEPVPTTFDRLRLATRHQPRIKPFNIALGDAEGRARLNLTPSAGSNTLLDSSATIGSVDVVMTTIDSFATAHRVDAVDFLKIDVEGYELEVLQGASRLLGGRKVRYVFAECVLAPDTSTPHTSFFDLHRVLDPLGFCFVNYYPESFSLRMGCAMGNVLYALKSALPASVPGGIQNIF